MDSYYQRMRESGISRRDFMRFCALTASMFGMSPAAASAIADSLEQKPRVPIVWLHGMECTGCSTSLLRSEYPLVTDVLTSMVSMDYFALAMAAAGDEAEEAMQETIRKYRGRYLLVVEGSSTLKDGGAYCMIAGRTFQDQVKHAARDAAAVLAVGSCASWGNVQAARPNPTEAVPISQVIRDKPIIKIPGCPPIAEVMTGILSYVVTFDRLPDVDGEGRPKMFYSQRVHDKCYRRSHFDAGQFVERWDDEGAKRGYCLYRMGCRGPTTYNACTTTAWNGGVSNPIRSGHGCLGCSESAFFDRNSFYDRIPEINKIGLEKRADEIGLAALAGAAAVVGAHTVGRMTKTVVDRLRHRTGAEGSSVEGT